MKAHLIATIALTLLLGSTLSARGFIAGDTDGDGVPDSVDACPTQDASGFDRNGDGCIDDAIGARHIEYWSTEDSIITYVINDQGAPGVGSAATNTAVQAAFNSWTSIPGTNQSAVFGGTTTQSIADGLDHINLVTFEDNTYPFGLSTLAVGLTTTFDSDTLIAGRVYRKGEIYDSDMLFNPNQTFKAGGAGPGSDIQSVATHEAGHVFGISHSAIKSSTMFYVLPGGTAARTLSSDDQRVYYKAYASPTSLAAASRLKGTVLAGADSAPMPGVLVFAISATSADTAACAITLPDGSFDFAGLPDGSYYVGIHPLDGTSDIGYIQPGYINELVAGNVRTDFQPEYYDAAESNSDDPNARTGVTVSAGSTANVQIITNIDVTPPVVAEVKPVDGSTAVQIDGAFIVRFSERIDVNTISSAFSFQEGGSSIGGNVAVIRDDSVIAFTPSTPLQYSTDCVLTIDTSLKDRAGNHLASDFTASYTTEAQPPLSISSLAPSKGVPGTTISVNGFGFSTAPSPTVTINGMPATVLSAAPSQLLVAVPAGATTGDVVVANPDLSTSNAVVFTVLSETEVARGYESGTVDLADTPNAIAVSPDGSYAYVAEHGGVDAVVIDAGAGGYLTRTRIADPATFDDLAITPDGRRVYAVSGDMSEMTEIDSDPTAGTGLFNTILSKRQLSATPRGIEIDPAGTRAYVSVEGGDIQIWDVRLGSPTYRQQVGVLHSPDGIALSGPMAITPDGGRLLAPATSSEVFFFALGPDTLLSRTGIDPEPRGIAIDPQGVHAYVTHDGGSISVLNIAGTSPYFVQDVSTGGSLQGLDTTPAGLYLYAADRTLDRLEVVDLDQTHTTFRSVIATSPLASNPVDVQLSSDGIYAYSVLQGSSSTAPRLSVMTVGLGPTIASVVPAAGQPGTKVVITGTGLYNFSLRTPLPNSVVDFNGVTATAESNTSTEIIVTVPAGVTSGPLTVHVANSESTTQTSNAVHFQAIQPATVTQLRLAQQLGQPVGSCSFFVPRVAFSPDGSYLYAMCSGGGGQVFVYDIRPGSPQFNQPVAQFPIGQVPSDLAITADGKVAICAIENSTPLLFYADPNDPRFGTPAPDINFAGGGFPLPSGTGQQVRTSPDNRMALLTAPQMGSYYLIDAADVSGGATPTPAAVDSSGGTPLHSIFHPTGRAAYVLTPSILALDVIDTDPNSATFGVRTSSLLLNTLPTSFDVSRDGHYLYVYESQSGGNYDVVVQRVNVTNPDSAFVDDTCVLSAGDPLTNSNRNALRIAPQGTFGIRTQANTGFISYFPLDCTAPTQSLTQANINIAYEFTPDGRHIYSVNSDNATLTMYDFLAADSMVIASGNNQSGTAGTQLPAPTRVRILTRSGTGPVDGVPIIFEAQDGGALTVGDSLKTIATVATDAQGYAQVQWTLGPVTGVHQLDATAEGLGGSPLTFTASAVADPDTLPLSVAEVIPLDGTTGISPTTAVLATFSRAVDRSSIGPTTFFVREATTGALVAGTYGYADGDRKVSITPSAPLALGTSYQVVLTGGIQATNGGGALTAAQTTGFTTVSSEPLHITSVWPPSAIPGVQLVISGTGFDPTASVNVVDFNSLAATPTSGTTSELDVNVPPSAITGLLTVVAHGDTSNAVPFTVLVPTTSPIDEVVATIGTGTGARTCAVSPDGALCYTVSPSSNVVIPINVDTETAYPSIPVGDQPVAIVINPDGSAAYVANFNAGTVSVIDTHPPSPNFNKVVSTIAVGTNPTDVAIAPDGSRVAVANAGSSDVSIVDSDASSATYNQVVATIGTGTGARSVAISPDGTVYVGTDTGFVVISTANAVVATIGTGTGARSVAISPDGTLLFLLTTDGDVDVVDIRSGSAQQNQVVATIGTGTGARSVAVSPDGTLLYVIPEIGDEVLVVAVSEIPGVAAINPDATLAPINISSAVIDTVAVGRDPGDVAVDPSGSGLVFVPNTADKTLSIINGSDVPTGALSAWVQVKPHTLNLQSGGKYVSGGIQLPPSFFPQEIDLSSIRLQHTLPIVPGSESYMDTNGDGIEELWVKFSRVDFQAVVPEGDEVPVTIDGMVRHRSFAGVDTIRTLRPTVTHPGPNDILAPGQATSITWDSPASPAADHADVYVSLDDGTTWAPVALQMSNTGTVPWTTPAGSYDHCRVMVTLWLNGDVLGQGMSQDPFLVAAPVATTLKSITVAIEDGAAVLDWETNFDFASQGFTVARSRQETGDYRDVTSDVIPAHGSASGSEYQYRDGTIHANRTYWYKLREVSTDGRTTEFGPYQVVYRLAYGLDQNMPNPFNPTTAIRYALAADGDVHLVVYDVAGREVRDLVDGFERADRYRVTWDGRNDRGQSVASGVYFYRLVAGRFHQTRKMVLLK